MQAEVPNPHTLLTNVPPDAKYLTVIDLCGAFFCVPHLFAFTYRGKQYTYTRMPQGFKHSPHVFNQVLKDDLEELVLHGILIQYVDDLLICSPTLEQCHEDSMTVLNKLAIGGHKVSQKKLQYCQTEGEYLGRLIAHQTRTIAPSQLEGICKAPKPATVRQMMTFLGMTGFSSDWIEDYAQKTTPLIINLTNVRYAQKNNVRKTITTPLGHIPTPEGPFRPGVTNMVPAGAVSPARTI